MTTSTCRRHCQLADEVDDDDNGDAEDAADGGDAEDEDDEDNDLDEAPFSLPGCQSFAQMGYCHRFKPLAHHYCSKSCKFCAPTAHKKKHTTKSHAKSDVLLKGHGITVGGAAHVKVRDRGEML
jgi:hypothetical protein